MAKVDESRSPSPCRTIPHTHHRRHESDDRKKELEQLSKCCSGILRYDKGAQLNIKDGGWALRDDLIKLALRGRKHVNKEDVITVLTRAREDGSYRFETMRDPEGVWWTRALPKRAKKYRKRDSSAEGVSTESHGMLQVVQLQFEPLPKQPNASDWLQQRPPAGPHGGQQPVPIARQGPVPDYHTPTPAMKIDQPPLEARFKNGDAVKVIHCGIPGCIGHFGVMGQPRPDVFPGLWTVNMDNGKTVCCDVRQLQLCSDPLQADGGPGTASSGPPSLANVVSIHPAPVAIQCSSQQPRSNQQRVWQSVRLYAPSGHRDLHLDIHMTVQDILQKLLPSELRAQSNMAIFNSFGLLIEPNVTVGELGEESEQVFLQFLPNDW